MEFVCEGRGNVFVVHAMCARDGRALDRCHFFVDKDLNDVLQPGFAVPAPVFQTATYSFENYLVCETVLRRFWVERMRLDIMDERYAQYVSDFHTFHAQFGRKMRLLMAMVLIGHGIDGRRPVKLNLNNANLDKVMRLDFGARRVRWMVGGAAHFCAACNLREAFVGAALVSAKPVLRKYLIGLPPKVYIRGKYELWFMVKYLSSVSRELADRNKAKAAGRKRAAIGDIISEGNCMDSLPALAPCPQELTEYLRARMPPPAPVLGAGSW